MKTTESSKCTGQNSWTYSLRGNTITMSKSDVQTELYGREYGKLPVNNGKELRKKSENLMKIYGITSGGVTENLEKAKKKKLNYEDGLRMLRSKQWGKKTILRTQKYHAELQQKIRAQQRRITMLETILLWSNTEADMLVMMSDHKERNRISTLENLAAGRWPHEYV